MTPRSFAEVIRAMIQESRFHKMELEACAVASALSGKERHAIKDVLHTEVLRLDMLQAALTEWEKGEYRDGDPAS